jgi:hypothetical protein
METENEQIRAALLEGRNPGTIDPETLEFCESELVEEYLENSLSPNEIELFKTNFLVTNERQDLLNELRLLKRVSSDAFVFDAKKFEEAAKQKTKQLPEPASRIGSLLLILVILAVVAFIAWRLLQP